MNNGLFNKGVTGTILLASLVSAATGCTAEKTGSAPAPGTTGQSTAPAAPVKITMLSQYETPEPPGANNPVVRKIEELTNTKLDITWVLNSNYTDKLNVTIASNDLPQAVLVVNPQDSVIVNAAVSGFFWDVEPFLKDYPNLSKLDKDTLNNTRINGKIYGLYRGRYPERIILYYRHDWLTNVGIKEAPKNVEEYYQMLKAFTFNDPNKSGKQDTRGITEDKTFGTYTFPLLFGAPNGWGYINNQVIPEQMTKEYMDYLKFFKKLYDEKILNQDFATAPQKKPTDDFMQGVIGVRGTTLENYRNEYYYNAAKVFPGGEVRAIPALVSTTGQKRVQKGPGFLGMYMFPKSSVKTEAELRQILTYFDRMYDDKLVKTVMLGVEGVHYQEESGGAVKILDETKYSKEVVPVVHLASRIDLINNGSPLAKEAIAALEEIKKYGVADATAGLNLSDAGKKKLSTIKNILDDARIKFVMGVIDEAGYKKEVDKWLQMGGNDIIKEYTELYNKYKK
ncbi:extracellular solute-binding protein [Paenibacillus piri]|uniref:Extracellular solute-binding protein n=1 Tax=Paenibacillus piri TaxID=2547395 RepID=A0A4R5KC42_9BACL|nr:extracellular solute-binding protein [Paenibacillus piri]TDF92781.1 extracellular solute-binding protein [Paenibacillus piri]